MQYSQKGFHQYGEVHHPHQVLCGRIDTNSAFSLWPYCVTLPPTLEKIEKNLIIEIS